MTYIYIQTLGTKTMTQKRNLVKEVTKVIARNLDVKPGEVRMVFEEVREEDFGAEGVLWVDRK